MSLMAGIPWRIYHKGLWRENGAISWIQSPLHKHMPHQSHGLAMDKQSEQGSEPEKIESNGQTPQTRQTEERVQHGSWQTSAQKENMEQKRGRDQLSPSQRSDSKAVALRGRTQQRKLTSHYEVSSSVRLRRAARARQGLLKQSASMAGSTADMVKSLGRFRRPGASSLGHGRNSTCWAAQAAAVSRQLSEKHINRTGDQHMDDRPVQC